MVRQRPLPTCEWRLRRRRSRPLAAFTGSSMRYIDHFGNVRTSIRAGGGRFDPTSFGFLEIGDQRVAPLVRTYNEAPTGSLFVLIDSSGHSGNCSKPGKRRRDDRLCAWRSDNCASRAKIAGLLCRRAGGLHDRGGPGMSLKRGLYVLFVEDRADGWLPGQGLTQY